MQQVCIFLSGRHINRMACTFFLRFPARPLSGLLGESDSTHLRFLTWSSRLASALVDVLEGVTPLYTFLETFMRSNIAQVNL